MKEVETLRKPNDELIAHLCALLEEAQSGQVKSMAYVVEYADAAISHGYAIDNMDQLTRIIGELMSVVVELSFENTRHAETLYE